VFTLVWPADVKAQRMKALVVLKETLSIDEADDSVLTKRETGDL